ncbi:MAG: S-methyl-5'-thioadenosine phosphorylase [Anaerolineaceae bacterium]|nr:S-methyl-5'-thioadenosine phosphorylase [Anaerolineaceae bacterium]
MAEKVQIAVIGGSGLYKMPELTDIENLHITTPFGNPSGEIVIGTLRGKRVAFLPRHGVGHIYSPSTVPYKANIYALKSLGVRFIVGVNACGSLKEEYAPGNIVIPDQLFDYTNSRDRSFFGTGMVAHVGVAEPYCPELCDVVFQAVQTVGGLVHKGGTFLIEEGPRFATRAESLIFKAWGCSLIGMTTCPEVFLAREAEIAYATMAHVTDYDSWHTSEEAVTVEMVMSTFQKNIALAQKALAAAVALIDENAVYACHSALANAIMTDRSKISAELIEALEPIVGRYFG